MFSFTVLIYLNVMPIYIYDDIGEETRSEDISFLMQFYFIFKFVFSFVLFLYFCVFSIRDTFVVIMFFVC